MSERLFSKDHVWILQNGKTATIGISDYAQAKLKTVLFLNLPDNGSVLVAGKRFGDIESIKTVSDLISPISGSIIKINEDLIDDPSQINEDPYGSWFFEAEVNEISEGLMTEKDYKETL